jgi:lipopolysaccharide export system protein LptA
MSIAVGRSSAIALIVAALACASAAAATAAKPPPASSSPMLPGGNSKEPISIDADKLNYYDKEQKAIYTGNVVVIQGDSQLTCSVMTVFLTKADAPAAGAPANAASPPTPAPAAASADVGGPGGSQVRHLDATGPVKIVSKTQVATGDRASYDKVQNKVWLFGNVTMSDGGNVTKGDRLTYDLTTGEAIVGNTGRVHAQIIQGSGSPDDAEKSPSPKKDNAAGPSEKKENAPSPGDKPKPAKKQAAGDAPPKQ